MSKKDDIFANPLGEVARFRFDQSVVDVFPDMIQRSVPGYSTIIAMIGTLAERFAQANSRCYDLGCSTGAATLAMRHQIPVAGCEIIAVDSSQAMIDRARILLAADSGQLPVQLSCDTLQKITLENASVVVLNFTLQFIPVQQREQILQKIYHALLPGGVLILSEKIKFPDSDHQHLMTDLHHAFKSAHGYSTLEIAQKRTALENVLIPETLQVHRERLKRVGFNSADVWFQCFNFTSLIAIKQPDSATS